MALFCGNWERTEPEASVAITGSLELPNNYTHRRLAQALES